MGINIKKIVKWLGIATLVFVSCCVLLLAAAGGGENKSNSQGLLDSSPTPELVNIIEPTNTPEPTSTPKPTAVPDMCAKYTVLQWATDSGDVLQLLQNSFQISATGNYAEGYLYALKAQQQFNKIVVPTCDTLVAEAHDKVRMSVKLALDTYQAMADKDTEKVTSISEEFVLLQSDLNSDLQDITNKYR